MDSLEASENWKRDITPEMREQIDRLHGLTAWTSAKIFALFGIWAVCGALAVKFDALAVRIPCWLVIGFVYHGLGVFMHEGAHGSIFRRGKVDRVVGFLCGLPLFFPCSSYRATHMLHHRYENTEKDPDNLTNFPIPALRALIFYIWFLVGMPLYIIFITLAGPFRAQGWKNKLAAVIEPLLIAAFFVGLFHFSARYGWSNVLINAWAMAIPFGILIANFRGLAEHTQLPQSRPPDPLLATRSLTSNAWMRFFFNNQNYHLEHHLFPAVPWNRLGEVHRVLQPIYRARHASVCSGYWQWARDAFRYGPLRTVRYDGAGHRLDEDSQVGVTSSPAPVAIPIP